MGVKVEVPVPTEMARRSILEVQLRDVPHSISTEDAKTAACAMSLDCTMQPALHRVQEIISVAASLHGYVGADIAALVAEAVIAQLDVAAGTGELTAEGLESAMAVVRPSAMRQLALEIPNVNWEDVGGQASVKQMLKEAIEWPMQHPQAFKRLGVRAPRGLLLYGPPGCSKTLLAKALATESRLNFIAVKGPELFSKWVGESEKAVMEVFQKARLAAPAIVFFDEIDALAVARGNSGSSGAAERVLSQLLTELDGVTPLGDVMVIAATNRPDLLDEALLRPGRLDRVVYCGLPEEHDREKVLAVHTRDTPVDPQFDLCQLARSTAGYSAAELMHLVREAAMKALQENPDNQYVSQRHFDAARAEVLPRTPPELLALYHKFGGQRKQSKPNNGAVNAVVSVDLASLEAAFSPQAIPPICSPPVSHLDQTISNSLCNDDAMRMTNEMADLEVLHKNYDEEEGCEEV